MDCLFSNFKTSAVVFHNLAYDGGLIRSEFNIEKALEKGRQIFTQSFTRNGHVIEFIDSYAKIPYQLSLFPKIFYIKNIVKEIFPYKHYSSQRVFTSEMKPSGMISDIGSDEKPERTVSQKQQFIDNLTKMNLIVDSDFFDMMGYAKFYCIQDVVILDQGYSKFHKMFLDNMDLLNLNIDNFATIPSIANHYFIQKVYIPDGIYMLSGILKEFVMMSVQGDRCMTAWNEQYHTVIPLSDFDAVSLYPSAMWRLWTVLGTPGVIPPEHLNFEFLLARAFTEDQTVADSERFIGTCVVEIEITSIAKP